MLKRIAFLAGVTIISVWIWLAQPIAINADDDLGTKPLKPSLNSANAAPEALWRFGTGQVRNALSDYNADEITSMRFGWYMDWSMNLNVTLPPGVEYLPMVRVKQWKLDAKGNLAYSCSDCPYATPYTYTLSQKPSQIREVALKRPGMVWVIGNEMEHRDSPTNVQDEIVPELYAQAYHQVYTIIKSADPTAQVAIGGMVAATPLRLKYLDKVWETYLALYRQPMPVDVWNIHAYVLPEKSCKTYPDDCWGSGIPAGLDDKIGMTYGIYDNKNFDYVKLQITNMRTWMKQRGQQNKPLIITEYGVNMPDWIAPGSFTPEQIRDNFMYPSFEYLLNHTDPNLGYAPDNYRLVQRWNWYSLDDDMTFVNQNKTYQTYNSNLFNSGKEGKTKGVSQLGQYWQHYVRKLSNDASPIVQLANWLDGKQAKR